MTSPEAANERFFITAGFFSNRQIAQVVAKNFPEYKNVLPSDDTPGGDFPKDGVFDIDNSKVKKVLAIEFRSFEESVTDTVKSLKDVGA